MKYLLKGGHVIDPKNNIDGDFDVLIENGIIIEIAKNIKSHDADLIDIKNKHVFPGLVDAHCHLREPGFEYKEDIASGTRSAAMGGFTSIACMPNTNPVIDNKTVISYIISKAKEEGVVNVFPIGALSKGQKGQELAEIGEMKFAGAVAISDDGYPVKSASLMKKALLYSQMFDMPVISHCEDLDLAEDGVMNEGYQSTIMGLKGIPSAAEEVMVSRDLIISEYTNLPVHIAHVSTKLSIELIRSAKKRGVKVTCETCPHYFTLTDEACEGYNTLAKVNPPLRGQKDVDAVIEGLTDGTIDIIVTDHAPHHIDEKNCEFNIASNGIVGFETALSLGITKLVMPGHITMIELIKKMSYLPAQILHLNKGFIEKNTVADLIVVDILEKYKFDKNKLSSKSKNTPFDGYELTGRVHHTIVNGNFVVKNSNLI